MSETRINKYGDEENVYMTVADWQGRWSKGHTGFHKADVHPMLEKHIDRLETGRSAIKIFVPLCGKSVDMKWLYDRGHTVVGVEGVAQAVTEFFDEQQLQYVTEPVDSVKGTLYKTQDGRLRVYCCHLFNFNSSTEGAFDGIWDRGSMVAINAEDLKKYRDLMVALMNPGTRYLLATNDYDPSLYSEPPYFISEGHIAELYVGQNVERIDYVDVMTNRQKEWGLDWFYERVHLINPK